MYLWSSHCHANFAPTTEQKIEVVLTSGTNGVHWGRNILPLLFGSQLPYNAVPLDSSAALENADMCNGSQLTIDSEKPWPYQPRAHGAYSLVKKERRIGTEYAECAEASERLEHTISHTVAQPNCK